MTASSINSHNNEYSHTRFLLVFLLSCLACLSTKSNALLASPSLLTSLPSKSNESKNDGRQIIFAPLLATKRTNHANDQSNEREKKQEDFSPNNLFNGVGNLFHNFFSPSSDNDNNNNDDTLPNIPMPSIPKSILPNLSNILPDIDNLLKKVPSSAFSHGKNNEKYQQVNEFDADLARDIEEALELANELAATRGLGDMTLNDDNSARGSNKSVRESSSSGSNKSSMFQENNLADLTLGAREPTTLKRGTPTAAARGAGKSASKSMEANMPLMTKSMFQENNAAYWNVNDVGVGLKQSQQQSRVNLNANEASQRSESRKNSNVEANASREGKKPSLFGENNNAAAADLPRTPQVKPVSRANDIRSKSSDSENYMNVADVKQKREDGDDGTGLGQTTLLGGNTKGSDSLNARKLPKRNIVDVAHVTYEEPHKGGGGPYPISKVSKPNDARVSKKYHMDTATATNFNSPRPTTTRPVGNNNMAAVDNASQNFFNDRKLENTSTSKLGSLVAQVSKNGNVIRDNGDVKKSSTTPKPRSAATGLARQAGVRISSSSSMREKNAQETYQRYKEYFEGGNTNIITDGISSSRSRSNNNRNAYHPVQQQQQKRQNARQIFITEQAHELATSLKLDIYEIFQYKKLELDLNGYGNNDGMDIDSVKVTENDVREYLDQRYEQLFSMLSSEEEEDGRFGRRSVPRLLPSQTSSMNLPSRRTQNRSRNNSYDIRQSSKGNANGYNGLSKARDQYYEHQRENEDANGWRRSRSRQYASEEHPRQSRSQLWRQQQIQRGGLDQYQPSDSRAHQSMYSNNYNQWRYDNPDRNDDRENNSRVRQTNLSHRQMTPTQGTTDYDMVHGRQNTRFSSVPLSQLVSNPRSERIQNQVQYPEESHDLSHFQHMPRAYQQERQLRQTPVTRSKFQRPYQELSRNEAIKSVGYNRPRDTKNDEYNSYFAPRADHDGEAYQNYSGNLAA